MATTTFSAAPTNGASGTGTEIQSWVQAIHNSLIAIGMVQTSDTGQAVISSLTNPSGTVISAGYEIWRFNDALQSTYPLYFKLEYGRGGATSNPVMWLTVGKGTNGAGTITGVVFPRMLLGYSGTTGWASSTAATGYASSDGGAMCAVFPFVGMTSVVSPPCFLIERARNVDGTPRGDALAVAASGGAGSTYVTVAYMDWATGVNAMSGAVALVPYSVGGTVMGSGTSLASGVIGPIIPALALVPGVVPWQPLSVVAFPPGDVPATPATIHALGSDRTYLPLPATAMKGWVKAISPSSSTPLEISGGIALLWE